MVGLQWWGSAWRFCDVCSVGSSVARPVARRLIVPAMTSPLSYGYLRININAEGDSDVILEWYNDLQ